jgi:hypothetical protein
MGPEEAVALLAVVGAGTITVVTIAKLAFRRLELRDQARAMSSRVEERLQRIEEAVDAMAIEMERMSDSQRFTTKLLAERLPAALEDPSRSNVR